MNQETTDKFRQALPLRKDCKTQEELENYCKQLMSLAIALIGDYSASINRGEPPPVGRSILPDLAEFFYSCALIVFEENKDYFLLLSAATDLLNDMPGWAEATALKVPFPADVDAGGLENLLLCLSIVFKNYRFDCNKIMKGPYSDDIRNILHRESNNRLTAAKQLRSRVYESGSSRELLFADLITAIIQQQEQKQEDEL